MFRWLILLCSVCVFAQQQVIPKEMDRKQKKLFEELTQAVSAPCCNNGIPVAFHMSPMANEIRNQISAAVLANQSKKEIMDMLDAATYGPNKQKIIFTIPEKTASGWFAYILPAVAVLLGIAFVFAYRNHRPKEEKESDDELLANYKDAIMERIGPD